MSAARRRHDDAMSGIGADDFRRLALALPGAVEGAHMGHADPYRFGFRLHHAA